MENMTLTEEKQLDNLKGEGGMGVLKSMHANKGSRDKVQGCNMYSAPLKESRLVHCLSRYIFI